MTQIDFYLSLQSWLRQQRPATDREKMHLDWLKWHIDQLFDGSNQGEMR